MNVISPRGRLYSVLSDIEAQAQKTMLKAGGPFAVGVGSARDLLIIDDQGQLLDFRSDTGESVFVAASLEAYLGWHAQGIASGDIAELSDGSLALLSQLEGTFEWGDREIAPGATAAMLEGEGRAVVAKLRAAGKLEGMVKRPRSLHLLALTARTRLEGHASDAIEALEADPDVDEFFFDEAQLLQALA